MNEIDDLKVINMAVTRRSRSCVTESILFDVMFASCKREQEMCIT